MNKEQIFRPKIFQAATKFYREILKKEPMAMEYLQRRHHPPELIDRFEIGATPGNDRRALYRILREQFFGEVDMLESGLIRSWNGELQDYFPPGVIVFPLMEGGKTNHFRIKDPAKKQNYQLPKKYNLNGQLFYNQDDFRFHRIIIVEGENDVLTVKRLLLAEQLKDTGVIGILGTFSQEQIQFLFARSQKKELFAWFDNDQAGLDYTEKLINACAGVVDISVIQYGEDGDDPDSFLNINTATRIIKLIETAAEGITWKIFRLPDANTALAAKKAAKPAVQLVAKIKDPLLIDMLIDDGFRKKWPALKRPAIIQLLKKEGAEIGSKVQSFDVYDSASQIFVSENSYWIPTKDDRRMISNFQARISNIYTYEDAQTGDTYLKYECILTNYQGTRSRKMIFEPAERVNPLKFMERCAGQGEFRFWGNAQNLSHVWSFIEQNYEDRTIINLLQKYGFLEKHGLWLFENCAIKGENIYPRENDVIQIKKTGFKSENVLVYGGDRPRLNYQFKLTREFREKIIENFWLVCDGKPKGFGHEFKGLIGLGFLAATAYRNEIMSQNGSFPELFFYGPSGTGKTTIAQILFKIFGFANPPETWESATIASMSQMMAQLSHLPLFLDEYRNEKSRQQDQKISLLRNAWNGAGAGKGGRSGIRQIFKILSVIMLAGEDLPTDKGALSRFVVMRFDGLNSIRNEAYKWLICNRENLSPLFLNIIKRKNKSRVETLLKNLKKHDEALLARGVMDERTRKNYAAILAGIDLLEYRQDDAAFREGLMDFMATQGKEDIARKQQEDILLQFFGHIIRLMHQPPFSQTIKITDGEQLSIAFNEFYHELKKDLRQAGDDLGGFKKTTILEYIIKSPFFIKQKNGRKDKLVRFGGADEPPKRAICLNINKLPIEIKEIFQEAIPEKKFNDF